MVAGQGFAEGQGPLVGRAGLVFRADLGGDLPDPGEGRRQLGSGGGVEVRAGIQGQLELPIERQRRAQEVRAKLLELRLLQEDVLAGPGVIRLDRLAPRSNRAWARRTAACSAATAALNLELESARALLRAGLEHEDRRQAGHGDDQARRGGGDQGPMALRPAAGLAVQGSRQAETGSSAIQCSMSSARARGAG